MSLSKQSESFLKKIVYFVLGIFFHNKLAHLPLSPQSVKRVLVLRYDAIGDMIITTPLFRFIKKLNPNILIDVIASEKNKPIVEENPDINNIFLFDRTFKSSINLIRLSRKNKYDIVLALVTNKTTFGGIVANLCCGSSALKATLASSKRKELYSKLFNFILTTNDIDLSLAELQLQLISQILGVNYQAEDLQYILKLNPDDISKAENFYSSLNNKPVVIYNISTSEEHNKFSTNKNIDFLKKATALFPDYIFVISADKSDYTKAEEITSNLNNQNVLFKKTETIIELAALVSICFAVISPDTSVVHIASAFNKPTLAFYSGKTTTITRWLSANKLFKFVIADGKSPIETIDIDFAINKLTELIKEIGEDKF